VLRKLTGPAGYVQDTDPSDFTLDILLENTDYITNLSGTGIFNITQYDMVLVKYGGVTGVDNAIHAFATKGGGSAASFYQTVSSYKLVSPDGSDAGGGSFHYPLSPTKKLSDFNGTSAAISKSTAFNWGYGFGQNNADYIQAIRDSVIAPPTQLSATGNADNRINLSWLDNTSSETGYEVLRSLDGITYVSLA
jgi:hypothetical protein